jgi:hypothetical protein
MHLVEQWQTRLSGLTKRCFNSSDIDLNQRISLFSVIGLPLLYASAYFLPALVSAGSYFLPSRGVFSLVVLPTLVAVAFGGLLVYAFSTAVRHWCSPRVATVGAVVILSVLTLIALKGIVAACGYDWQDRIPRGQQQLSSLHYFKIGISFAVVLMVWVTRGALPQLNRLLSSAGFAFGALATIRLFLLWNGSQAILALPASAATSAAQSVQANSVAAIGGPELAVMPSRRVVWVLFDETDFDRIYSLDGETPPKLKTFAALARSSVFATNANSPASATLYSIPALLTGVPIGGDGIRIDTAGSLSLQRVGAKSIPFGEATSIFGALAVNGRGASVLGFFHPYCKVFELSRCDSFPFPEIGGLDAALWSNIPDSISAKLRHMDYWESITEDSLRLLPQYLARDDALTFVHLNFPHLPADYADQISHLAASPDPLIEYSRNLLLADRILGEITQDLQRQSSRHELLLVVSSDHWLRNRWYRANVPEVSRRIPLIIWKVGDTNGYVLSQQLSTVHTAAMILDYLNGSLTTQAEIAQWWASQPVYPSFIAPNT